MKVLLFLTLLGLGLASSAREEFSKVYAKYAQADGMMSEGPEAIKSRFLTFKKNLASVAATNADQSKGWTATVDNQFSILSDSERDSYLGLNASSMDLSRSRRSARSAGWETPILIEERAAEVDYVDKLPAIKNQGGCGSCWAFGAMVALEYQVNRKPGSSIKSLSEQQFLDCTYEGSRNGCNGGWPTQCYVVAKAAGSNVASSAKIPYVAKDNACGSGYYKADNNGMKGYTISGYEYLDAGDTAMLTAVANEEIGVISVAIGVYSTFFSYDTGVWGDSDTCASKNINHAVDVVGYGTESGADYWRVRNSWGVSWGDDGYIKMARGENICKIASYGHYPTVSGQDADDGSDDSDGDDDSDDDDDSDGDDEESDDGCNPGLKKCCDGQCLHEHMCPAECEDEQPTDKKDEEVCEWQSTAQIKCMGKLGPLNMALEAAKTACEVEEKCVCVTCKRKDKKCGMRKKDTTVKAGKKFISYTCPADKIMK